MTTKSKISAYILRSSVAMLLVSCVIVALSSAINLPQPPLRRFQLEQNNVGLGVKCTR